VSTVDKPFKCSGLTGSVVLYHDNILIDHKEFGLSKTYQLPVGRIRAVMIERKGVIPFATLTLLGAIAAILTRYNSLWFIIELPPARAQILSSVATLATALFAIPTLVRTFFVSVSISWDGDPTSLRIGYVPARRGKRLAKKLRELSSWT
jgi:hypothetical protein